MSNHVFRKAALIVAIAAFATAAFAQKSTSASAKAATAAAAAPWPTRPVKIMVGFPGGSTPDLVARAIAEPLSKALGQPVIVENRPGAGGNIAADIVAKSTDQHTLGVMINGNLTIARLLNPKTPYDPAKDLAPISLIGTAPLVLAAPANAPGATSQDFLVDARNAGNKWSYGSPGIGTVGHIGMELFKTKTNIDPVHVPYPGNPQVVTAMIGGQIQLSLLPPALVTQQVKAGKLRAIGVTSLGRSPLAPEIPSLSESGVSNFQLEIWTAMAGPSTLPKPIIAKLSALVSEIVRTPEMRQKLYAQGWQTVGSSAEGLANRMKSDTNLLGGIIMMRNIKVD
ncbi:MAG: tripartite tricarboxylate transporter substrate binding protein [Burkholderiaceae bacterium]|nr:tripartite tricarboxylate transporter substrate binding protein [Burkholderiaceae bacterium]